MTDEQLKQLTTWIPPEIARKATDAAVEAAVMATLKVFYAAARDFDSYSKVKIQTMCDEMAAYYRKQKGEI